MRLRMVRMAVVLMAVAPIMLVPIMLAPIMLVPIMPVPIMLVRTSQRPAGRTAAGPMQGTMRTPTADTTTKPMATARRPTPLARRRMAMQARRMALRMASHLRTAGTVRPRIRTAATVVRRRIAAAVDRTAAVRTGSHVAFRQCHCGGDPCKPKFASFHTSRKQRAHVPSIYDGVPTCECDPARARRAVVRMGRTRTSFRLFSSALCKCDQGAAL